MAQQPVVYFCPVTVAQGDAAVASALNRLMEAADLAHVLRAQDLVALKMHFGEDRNNTHIRPEWVRPVVERVKAAEAKPFLTDTCVLYKSRRDNAVDHLVQAHDHGFTLERTGAPVVIADGLLGGSEREVPIQGELYQSVAVAELAVQANALLVLTHVTGHLAAGMGATIKNLGMGFASRKGKLKQHSAMKPKVKAKHCTRCGECLRWCPADAITLAENSAVIDPGVCIGCGECITVCRFSAVVHDWGVTETEIQKRMAEHALGVVSTKPGRVAYISFLLNMTRECDCMNLAQEVGMEDIGILVGFDPVAMDAAALDLVHQKAGEELDKVLYARIDARAQIAHGEKIGLGQSDYELHTIA